MQNQQMVASLWGGFQSDEDKAFSAGSGSALKLGLNQNVSIKAFAYTTKTGQGNTEGNPAIAITFDVNGTDVNTRIYNPGHKIYFKGKEVTDVNSPEYLEGLKQQISLAKGMITHYLKAFGLQEAQLQASLGSAPSFEALATIASQMVAPLLNTAKFDLFAHYQATIKNGSDRTFLEVPTDLSYGAFLTASTPGATWTETDSFKIQDKDGNVVVKKGLAYVNAAGEQHRFVRDEQFLKSKRATLQDKTTATPTQGAGGTASPFAQGGAASNPAPSTGNISSWGAK